MLISYPREFALKDQGRTSVRGRKAQSRTVTCLLCRLAETSDLWENFQFFIEFTIPTGCLCFPRLLLERQTRWLETPPRQDHVSCSGCGHLLPVLGVLGLQRCHAHLCFDRHRAAFPPVFVLCLLIRIPGIDLGPTMTQ